MIGGLVSLCEGPLTAGVCVSNITNYTMFVLGLFFFFLLKRMTILHLKHDVTISVSGPINKCVGPDLVPGPSAPFLGRSF